MKRDWGGVWRSEAELTSFCNSYIKFAYHFLVAKGYNPVSILLCDGYVQPGHFDFEDNQKELRMQIMSEFINPSKPKGKDLSYIDYGCKG